MHDDMSDVSAETWARRARKVASAKKETRFNKLVRLSGLDKTTDFSFANWSEVDFSGCDLDGFDFTGARLHGCNFTDARISGARFDQAEIGAVLHDSRSDPCYSARQTRFASLHSAADWRAWFDPCRWHKLARPLSADHLSVGAVFQDAPFAPELVIVPAGRFVPRQVAINVDEFQRAIKPVQSHRFITFDRPFAIGRFAVKRAEFAAFEFHQRRLDKPVSNDDLMPTTGVSWEEADQYCRWLNDIIGLPSGTYRIPSKFEWEFAARAGTYGPFWWKGAISRGQANYDAHRPVPVDWFNPNRWGLYQVHGNICEWCGDDYNVMGFPIAGNDLRICREGSWRSKPNRLEFGLYEARFMGDREPDLGFRVARTLDF